MSLPSEAFLADVLTEPETLGALLDAYEGSGSPLAALGDVHERRVLFVGMGSSRYAALAACSRLRSRGIDAAVEYASAAAPTPPAADQLVVAVSASGTTPETVEAAARHRGAGRVVAVTNAPASPLAEAADIVLPLLAGEEAGGIACRTYQATVAVLLLLGGEPAEALRPAVAAVDQLVATREEWCGPRARRPGRRAARRRGAGRAPVVGRAGGAHVPRGAADPRQPPARPATGSTSTST